MRPLVLGDVALRKVPRVVASLVALLELQALVGNHTVVAAEEELALPSVAAEVVAVVEEVAAWRARNLVELVVEAGVPSRQQPLPVAAQRLPTRRGHPTPRGYHRLYAVGGALVRPVALLPLPLRCQKCRLAVGQTGADLLRSSLPAQNSFPFAFLGSAAVPRAILDP